MIKTFAIPLLFAALAATSAEAAGPPKRLAEDLRAGGYVIYFRHFETGADYNDQHVATLGKCATQRQLNARGAAQAVAVRDAFVALDLPVGEVFASPFCRAWQSADLAFGRHAVVDGLKLPPSKDYTDADKATMRDALLPLIAAPARAGTNTVIVAHDDNIPTVGGPEVKAQGEAVVLKPTGNGRFEVVAQLKPDAWARLAKAAR